MFSSFNICCCCRVSLWADSLGYFLESVWRLHCHITRLMSLQGLWVFRSVCIALGAGCAGSVEMERESYHATRHTGSYPRPSALFRRSATRYTPTRCNLHRSLHYRFTIAAADAFILAYFTASFAIIKSLFPFCLCVKFCEHLTAVVVVT